MAQAEGALGPAHPGRINWRALAVVAGLALVVRLAAVLALDSLSGADAFLIADSAAFLHAAHGARELQFMPLYPAFLAAHAALLGPDPLWPVLSQAVVDSATCVVVARIAAELAPALELPAGVFAALNPTQVVMATLVLTETLFVFFAALALWAALAWLRRPGWRNAAGLGLVLGLGALTRVMLLPWAVGGTVLLVVLAAALRRPLRRAIAQAALALGLALVQLGPVLAANYARTGGWGLTNQGGGHALYWVVPLVIEARDGTPHADGARRMAERFEPAVRAAPDPFSRSRALGRAALAMLAELGPGPVIEAWAIGAAINLAAPAVILATPVRALPRTGFYATPGAAKLDKVWAFLFENDNPLYGWILVVSAAGTIACRAAQGFGLWRGARVALAGNRALGAALVLLLAWIGFILLVNGPVASAKYRAPIEPALAALAALAVRRPGAAAITAPCKP